MHYTVWITFFRGKLPVNDKMRRKNLQKPLVNTRFFTISTKFSTIPPCANEQKFVFRSVYFARGNGKIPRYGSFHKFFYNNMAF